MILAMFSFLIKAEANVVHVVYFQPADQPNTISKSLYRISSIYEV